MLKNAYLLAKSGADTVENEQHFAVRSFEAARRSDREPGASDLGALHRVRVAVDCSSVLAAAPGGASNAQFPNFGTSLLRLVAFSFASFLGVVFSLVARMRKIAQADARVRHPGEKCGKVARSLSFL